MPASEADFLSCASTLAVSAIMGVAFKPCSRSNSLRRVAAVKPSNTGICRSINTTSKLCASMRASACSPSLATVTVCPARSSNNFNKSIFCSISSTISTSSCGNDIACSRFTCCADTTGLSGKVKTKRVPIFFSLCTSIVPPISSTSCLLIVVPKPVPPNFRDIEASACANASKTLFTCSSDIPMPVSAIMNCTSPFCTGCTVRDTQPCSVNFTALPTRLLST